MADSYVVKRENICVGKVITDFEIICDSDKAPKIGMHHKYRSMLFVKDRYNQAIDLLYNSPKYPIFTPDNLDSVKDAKIIIDGIVNLEALLYYFSYCDEISYLGIEGIRKRFFNGKFPIQNYHYFGLRMVDPSEQTFYDSIGNPILDKNILEQLYKQTRRERKICRSQVFELDSVSPSANYCYGMGHIFDALRMYGDNTLYDVINGYEDRINAFKPHYAEGPIRSRKKCS